MQWYLIQFEVLRVPAADAQNSILVECIFNSSAIQRISFKQYFLLPIKLFLQVITAVVRRPSYIIQRVTLDIKFN